MTIPISTLWLAEIVKGKQQYINVGVQLHLKVIDDSLPKQGKANQGKGLFCTSSRTNEVPFIAHELVQHLPTAQCSFSKHEHDSPTRGDTLISLINVESTNTDFENFHPPQKQNPASTFIDFINIFQPPCLFQPPHLHYLVIIPILSPIFYSLGSFLTEMKLIQEIRPFFALKVYI